MPMSKRESHAFTVSTKVPSGRHRFPARASPSACRALAFMPGGRRVPRARVDAAPGVFLAEKPKRARRCRRLRRRPLCVNGSGRAQQKRVLRARADVGLAQRPHRQHAATRCAMSAARARPNGVPKSNSARSASIREFYGRVRARAVELVDRVDDGDPPASPPRPSRRRKRLWRRTSVRRRYAAAAPFIGRALENEEIAMRPRRHPPCHRVLRVDRERGRRGTGAAAGSECPGTQSAPCDRRAFALPMPFSPISMKAWGARPAIGRKQRSLEFSMAEQLVGDPRRRGFVDVALVTAHRLPLAKRTRRRRRAQPRRHGLKDTLRHRHLRRRRIDNDAALRLCRRRA